MFVLRVLLLLVMATVRAGAARDFDAMERRRKQAAALFRRGHSQADVARELKVSRQSVSRWFAEWRAGGAAALRGAGRAGRLPRLDRADLRRVERQLKKGPLACGYATEMWTLSRVGEVIEAETGVAYHPGHVWRILRAMGWSRQRPARRAVERDEQAIANWVKHEWPRVKNRQAPQRLDLLPRRVGLQSPPLGEGHVGAEGEDPGASSPVQLEAAVHVRRCRLRPGRIRCPAGVQHGPRCPPR